jgi:hypothetical protein
VPIFTIGKITNCIMVDIKIIIRVVMKSSRSKAKSVHVPCSAGIQKYDYKNNTRNS